MARTVANFLQVAAGLRPGRQIVIPAGTPEYKDLNQITSEPDAQKKIAMYEDFLQSTRQSSCRGLCQPAVCPRLTREPAICGGPWSMATRRSAGSPHNLDFLESQVTLAIQTKDNARAFKNAEQGGKAYDSIESAAGRRHGRAIRDHGRARRRPTKARTSFEVRHSMPLPQSRMPRPEGLPREVHRRFPNTKLQEPVASYAMLSLSERKDNHRLVAYAEKALAAKLNK
jgi:hypothetical protein